MTLPNRQLIDWLFKQLQANPLTLTELDLLRAWHKEQDASVAINSSFELFQQHFEMRNALYHLREQLAGDYELELGLLYVRLHPASDASTKVSRMDGLASYYMNANNLTAETPDSVAAMLEGFFAQWQRYHNNDIAKAKRVLGVANEADMQTVKRQYRTLANQHHPDKGGNAEQFNKIQQAYEVLKSASR
ncbi:DNA-J related domain-containing protein [Salinibius halmophilus]|uniref:DNA-J related domain-containing protein n=1 Tax=Salinibius halmophilus TaxID=1853216 RepID=UPI000E664FBD|nr:DNA-J related domain-containing protein [Salinibius halmophilus]